MKGFSGRRPGISARAFMDGFSSHRDSGEPKPFHGTVREDGRVFDARLPYGGGYVDPTVWELRQREASAEGRE